MQGLAPRVRFHAPRPGLGPLCTHGPAARCLPYASGIGVTVEAAKCAAADVRSWPCRGHTALAACRLVSHPWRREQRQPYWGCERAGVSTLGAVPAETLSAVPAETLSAVPAETLPETAPAPSPEPSTARPNIVALLRERGLLQDIAGEDFEKIACQESLAVYCGFDPTAESLHLGNLLGIIVLTWFQRCGHQPVALLGGATGRVGDPSGRSMERPVLSEEEIERNVQGIRRILEDLLRSDNGARAPPLILNNLDWFADISLLNFLRDVGKYARVGTMLSRDAVKSRMESDGEGISFTEFTYQLLQGYDYVHLNRQHGVRVQIGGSDQMGNVYTGLDLIRKLGHGGESSAFGLTFPLLTKADGTKMGKSADGAVWLSADKLSPFKFYQYLLTSVGDAEVLKFLRMLTFLPLEDIAELEVQMGSPTYQPNTAQRLLASEVTRFVHGEQGLEQALYVTQALKPGAETELNVEAIEAIAEHAPRFSFKRTVVVGAPLVAVMADAGLQPSKAAGKRLIKGGGVLINNRKIDDEAYVVQASDFIGDQLMLIAAGKKNKTVIYLEEG